MIFHTFTVFFDQANADFISKRGFFQKPFLYIPNTWSVVYLDLIWKSPWKVAVYFASAIPERSDCSLNDPLKSSSKPSQGPFSFPNKSDTRALVQRPEKSKLCSITSYSQNNRITRGSGSAGLWAARTSLAATDTSSFQASSYFYPSSTLAYALAVGSLYNYSRLKDCGRGLLVFKRWGMCRDDAPHGNRGLDGGFTSHIAYLYCHLCLTLSNANKKDFDDPSGSRRRI